MLTVDRADNSSPGDCTQSGKCTLSAALAEAAPGTELTIELAVDSVGVGMTVLPGDASVSVVGQVGGAAAADGQLARISGGFGTLFRVFPVRPA